MNNRHPLVIGITGLARAGKNSMSEAIVRTIISCCKQSSYNTFSFAKGLKTASDEECRSKHGISAFTEDSNLKEIIRPILIKNSPNFRGLEPKGAFFVNKVKEEMAWDWKEKNFNPKTVYMITDLRFAEYYNLGTDELNFVLKYGFVCHIDREGNKPASEEEQRNLDQIIKISELYDMKYIRFSFPDHGNSASFAASCDKALKESNFLDYLRYYEIL